MSTVKLDGWKPQQIPLEDEERKALQDLCVIAVQKVWANWRRPANLDEINRIVQAALVELRLTKEWRWSLDYAKRTVDRRVNEAASGEAPRIVAVTAGVYQPNEERRGIKN